MARLRNLTSGCEVLLRSRSLIGRSPRSDVRLHADGASMEHAAIHWDGAEWTLRDLRSRNGTRIKDTLLIGRTWRLAPGDELRFGDPSEVWCWVDGAPPRASAIRADGFVVFSRNGLLLLPDEHTPLASVSLCGDRWEFDQGASTRHVTDGEGVIVGGVAYQLDLPSADPAFNRTRTLEERRLVARALLTLRVSLNQEHVTATLDLGASKELKARSFTYLLLVLARVRQEDMSSGVPHDEVGWIQVHDLARKLNVSVEALNVDIHRLRRAVEELDLFDNPTEIIERRRTAGQLRLGTSNVSIH
jgi:FHA domain